MVEYNCHDLTGSDRASVALAQAFKTAQRYSPAILPLRHFEEDFPHNAHHREVSISISNYTLKHGDTGLIIVGGRMEMQPHIFYGSF